MPIIISNRKNALFGLYINYYLSLLNIFDNMFQFLYKIYFFCIKFKPGYFIKTKTFAFNDKLNILGFE